MSRCVSLHGCVSRRLGEIVSPTMFPFMAPAMGGDEMSRPRRDGCGTKRSAGIGSGWAPIRSATVGPANQTDTNRIEGSVDRIACSRLDRIRAVSMATHAWLLIVSSGSC